jgi:hypothetical protein
MLPLVGPLVEAGFAFAEGEEELLVAGIMGMLSSFIQIAGFTMAIIGHVRGRRARQLEERGVAVLPSSPGGPGLTVAGWF